MSDIPPGGEHEDVPPTAPVDPPPTGQFPSYPAGPPTEPPTAPHVDGEPLPPYVEPQPAKRRTGRFVAIAIGAVAVVGGGVFAAAALTGSDGAGSPEAAVESLFAAVENEDLIGVLETLPDGEREALVEPIQEINGELQRLGILSDDLDLEAIDGVDLEIEGLELEATELGEGVSAVRVVGGTVTATTEPDDVPVGETLENVVETNGGSIDVPAASETGDLSDLGIEIVAIEDDGWHVSLYYTIAEAARQEAGAPRPDFGNGIEPQGAGSPEDALRNLFDAGADLNLEGVIASLPPDEMRALREYAPLFLEDVNEAAAEVKADGFEFSIDDLGVTIKGEGDTVLAQVTTFAVSGDSPEGEFAFAFDGECFTLQVPEGADFLFPGAEVSGDEQRICNDEVSTEDAGALGEIVTRITDEVGFVMVQVDGEWYTSPTRSFFQAFIAILKAFEREDIENIDQLIEDIFVGLEGIAGAGLPPGCDEILSDPDPDFDDPEVQACFEAVGIEIPEEDDVPASTTTTTGETTETTAGPSTTEDPTEDGEVTPGELQEPVPPVGLGEDEELNGLAQACYEGDMASCDDLYNLSDFGSAYEDYGATCAGRLPDSAGFCEELIGPTAPN